MGQGKGRQMGKGDRKHKKKPASKSVRPPAQRGAHRQLITTDQPTAERIAKSTWHRAGSASPMVDKAPDMVSRLRNERVLSEAQFEAAQAFMEIRAAYVAELCVNGFKSCLAGGIKGHDDSDGNAAAVREYEALKERVGRIPTAILIAECEKGPDKHPRDLGALKNALDRAGY